MAKNNSTPNLTQLPLILEGETVSILLTKGFVTMVDAIDADLLQYRWRTHKSNPNWYARRLITKNGKRYDLSLHRVILERKIGRQLLKDEFVDHIDLDPMNNRRENLRVASKKDNNRNRNKSKYNTSGFKGVYRDKKKWGAQITVNNKHVYLGSYNSPAEAYAAYCEAAKKYFGEFARME